MPPRIVIVSEDLVEPWDEGIKKFAYSIGRALAPDHPVRLINVDRAGVAHARNGSAPASGDGPAIRNVPGTRTFLQSALRHEIASFQPEVLLYVPSPSSTLGSFVRAYALRRHWPRARLGMVALIPRRHSASRRLFLQSTAPDVVFVPSYASLLHLSDLSLTGEVIPVGVEGGLLRPAEDGERVALRRARGVPEDAFVYLHVGHLRPKRNLRALARLAAQPGAHVVVVGSTSTPEDTAVRDELERAGVRVIREYVPIHEFYRMADCYVFPTVDSEGCVEIPLSVMEALASGVPVLARPFGGLRDFLPPGADVRYFDTEDELVREADAMRRAERPSVRTMEAFAWRSVAERIIARLTAPAVARKL